MPQTQILANHSEAIYMDPIDATELSISREIGDLAIAYAHARDVQDVERVLLALRRLREELDHHEDICGDKLNRLMERV